MLPRCQRRPSTLRMLYWLCPTQGQPPSQPRIIRLRPAKSYSPLPLEEGSKSLSIRRRLLSRQLLIGETGWPICCVAQTAALVFFIGFNIALAPSHMPIAFKGKELGGKTVEAKHARAESTGSATYGSEILY